MCKCRSTGLDGRVELNLFNTISEQDGRPPPAYFAPSQFGEDAILKEKNVSSSKKTLFLHTIF